MYSITTLGEKHKQNELFVFIIWCLQNNSLVSFRRYLGKALGYFNIRMGRGSKIHFLRSLTKGVQGLCSVMKIFNNLREDSSLSISSKTIYVCIFKFELTTIFSFMSLRKPMWGYSDIIAFCSPSHHPIMKV